MSAVLDREEDAELDDAEFQIIDSRPGFTYIYNDVLDTYMAQMGPYAFGVYLALARCASGGLDPSFDYISKAIGVSQKVVQAGIDRLDELGLIAVTDDGYTILDPFAEK